MGDIGADRRMPDRPLTAEGRVMEVELRVAELTRAMADLEIALNKVLNWIQTQDEAKQ